MSSLRSVIVHFFMPKIKCPDLRELTSIYPSVVNDISKVKRLDSYKSNLCCMPPIYLTSDSGEIIPVDKNGKTADDIFNDVFETCEVLSSHWQSKLNNKYNEYDWLNDFKRIQNNRAVKQYRIRKKVEYLLRCDCLFLSLTFREDVLNNTSKSTRRRYVRDYLNSLGCKYLCNIDYGKTNGREHYHAIINTTNIDYSRYFKKCGSIKGERVIYNNYDAFVRYIWKFTNHAIKESTKCERVMTNICESDYDVLF